ncbi:hypothetical protein HDU93_004108, partial [Gonapodya sp. JEL0774]
DWTAETPYHWSQRATISLSAWSIFLPFPLDVSTDVGFFTGTLGQALYPQAGADGSQAQVMITLEPTVGGLNVAINNATAVQDVVNLVSYCNTRGVSVLLRFAHEMNGWWSAWAMRPTQYRAAFRAIANAIQACSTCGQTAMLWAPQVGVGYPWGVDIPITNNTFFAADPTGYGMLNRTELLALDTDGDGWIRGGDDPYALYWPGDDVVDWVGLSMYYAGQTCENSAFGFHLIPRYAADVLLSTIVLNTDGQPDEPYVGMFARGMTGLDYATGTNTQAPNFYQLYSTGKNKPFCLAETSVMHITYTGTNANATRLLLKQDWWRETAIASVFDQFPNYRSTWLFEWQKEDTIPGVIEDFSYTLDPATRKAFLADLPTSRIVFSNGVWDVLTYNATTVASSGTTAKAPSAATSATSKKSSTSTAKATTT